MKISEFNRSVWLWLFSSGGYWTAAEIARANDITIEKACDALWGMERRGLVKKQKSDNSRRLAYGVDGTCLVPCGMKLAEVQE